MRAVYQSEVAPLKSVLVKHARDAFVSDEAIDEQWKSVNFIDRPDLAEATREYDAFVELLRRLGVEVHRLPWDPNTGLDSIYTRDMSIVCNKGIILCNMGKEARRGEPLAAQPTFRSLGIAIHGTISGNGRVEGGDVVWLDERTVAVGRGHRTNDEGIHQLEGLLGDCIDNMIVVPLPHFRGPGDVFHLMSILSPIDHDVALVYPRLLPVPFREALISRAIELVEVPDAEFDSMGCNVLTVAPRKCVMLSGNPITRGRLEARGVTSTNSLERKSVTRVREDRRVSPEPWSEFVAKSVAKLMVTAGAGRISLRTIGACLETGSLLPSCVGSRHGEPCDDGSTRFAIYGMPQE